MISQPVDQKPASDDDDRSTRLKSALPGLVLNFLVPTIAYFLLNRHMSSAAALAWSGAIPVAATLIGLVRTHRASALGALSIAGFAAALAVSGLFGGSPLAFELQEPILTGVLGLVFLVSVLIHKPLFLAGLRAAARRDPAMAARMDKPEAEHKLTRLTIIIGATLAVHAATLTTLALTEPTSTYVALSKPVGLPILVAGAVAIAWHRRRT